MRLALITEGPLAYDGKDYYFSEGEELYIEKLASHFDEICIHAFAYRPDDLYYGSVARHKFTAKNISIVEMPLARSNKGKFGQLLKAACIIWSSMKRQDAFYIFMPGYTGAMGAFFCRIRRKPYMLYLAADWEESADILFPFKGSKSRFLRGLYKFVVTWMQNQAVRGCRCLITAGRTLFEKYESYGKPMTETIPRLNWPAFSLRERKDTCQNKTIRLLFVGYLLKRKGADVFVDAIRILNGRGYNVHGTLVGAGDEYENLKKKITDESLSSLVELKGHVNNGPELLAQYGAADIFVMPTFGGEGFPRVLYEAMSQSLPIVTTNVCGIDKKLPPDEMAVYAPPRDAGALADQVERLIKNPALRQKLIGHGYDFMKEMIETADGGRQVKEAFDTYVKPAVKKRKK